MTTSARGRGGKKRPSEEGQPYKCVFASMVMSKEYGRMVFASPSKTLSDADEFASGRYLSKEDTQRLWVNDDRYDFELHRPNDRMTQSEGRDDSTSVCNNSNAQ